MPGVLAEVVAWIDQNRVPPYAKIGRSLGQAGHRLHDIGRHVEIAHPVRPGTRWEVTGVGAHQTGR